MKNKRAIVWFRNDLRLHDNEALMDAMKHAEEIIPVFVFDERVFTAQTSFGFPKTGRYRAKFIIESIHALRKSLQELGSDLIVRIGITENIIADLAKEFKTSWVFCNRERTHEEILVQDSLEKMLWEIGQEVRYSRGKMLYYTADLPFPISHCPDTFSVFRKDVEKITPVRDPFPTPQFPMSSLPDTAEAGEIPKLESFGHNDFKRERGLLLKGGEGEALKELKYYFWDTQLVNTYKKTRNGLLGRDFSSKFSVYLSSGCLSPKMVYKELKFYEEKHGANESTYWLFFELLWRDFFRLMGKKYQNKIFQKQGIKQLPLKQKSEDMDVFSLWASGQTGVPLVDANMRELNQTGYMSNRGRQIVASFLINNLNLNWQLGAEYFESLLIDYDPCSNYGNWNYLAGVGNDPHENRVFNISFQSKKYDPEGAYVKYWIPELADVPSKLIADFSNMSEESLSALNLTLGKNYPHPIEQQLA